VELLAIGQLASSGTRVASTSGTVAYGPYSRNGRCEALFLSLSPVSIFSVSYGCSSDCYFYYYFCSSWCLWDITIYPEPFYHTGHPPSAEGWMGTTIYLSGLDHLTQTWSLLSSFTYEHPLVYQTLLTASSPNNLWSAGALTNLLPSPRNNTFVREALNPILWFHTTTWIHHRRPVSSRPLEEWMHLVIESRL